MEKIIDLHIHTTVSDGALTPKEVIDEAVKNGVSTIAIADHDTVEAYTEELLAYAKEKGIDLIPAVEISTKSDKCGIHVLGYHIDIYSEELRSRLAILRNARHDYLFDVSRKLKELGYQLNVEELDKIDAVTKAHIASDIVSNPINYDILTENFGHLPSKGEFIETVMNEGCPAYVKKNSITPKEASDLIRSAGGKVVLAHPVAYVYEDGLTESDILSLVQDMRPFGIEANYIYVDRNDKKINDISIWKEFSQKNNLHTTIGSDFHSHDGLRPIIGLINEELGKVDTQNILDSLNN